MKYRFDGSILDKDPATNLLLGNLHSLRRNRHSRIMAIKELNAELIRLTEELTNIAKDEDSILSMLQVVKDAS